MRDKNFYVLPTPGYSRNKGMNSQLRPASTYGTSDPLCWHYRTHMAHCNLALWSHRPTALASRRKAGDNADSAEASPLSLALFIWTRKGKAKVAAVRN